MSVLSCSISLIKHQVVLVISNSVHVHSFRVTHEFWFQTILLNLQVKTVKISNVSLGASEQDIKEFFSFSGDIEYVELQRFLLKLIFLYFPFL